MTSFVQWWNRNTSFNPLLQSRIVLYLFFFFSVVTLFGFSMNGDYAIAIIFLIVGFLTSFFSKNMIVIQFMALVVTNLLLQGIPPKGYRRQEGMTEKDDKEEEEDEEGGEKATVEDVKKEIMNNSSSKKNNSKKEVKKLLDLQLKLMTGVNSLQPVLKEVENAISNMRNSSSFQ